MRRVAIALAYLALVLVFTWPLAILGNGWMCGDQELPAFMWRSWWMREMLADAWRLSSGLPDRLAAVMLVGHFPEAGNLTDMMLAWPLQDMFGAALGHNLKVVALLTFDALCGYAAARLLRAPRSAAFVAGAVVAFNPYVVQMIDIGRMREAIVGWVALGAALGWRLAAEDEGRPEIAVACGAVWGMAADFYWFYGHFLFLWMAIAVTWRLVSRREGRAPLRIWARNLAIAVWVMLILTAPAAAPYLVTGAGDGSSMAYTRTIPSLDDLLAWHEPNDVRAQLIHSQQRMLTESLPPEVLLGFTRPDGLPLVVVLLALAALALRPREAAPWAVGAAAFYLLSLGPYLQWQGAYIRGADGGGLELPHAWLFRWLPAFNRLYAPNRAAAMLMVCLGMLAALALTAAFERARSRPWERAAAAALCVGGILGPMWMTGELPLRFIPARVAQGYHLIGAQPPLGAVLELPADANRDFLNFYQVTHRHALIGGWATLGVTPVSDDLARVAAPVPRTVARALDEGVTRDALRVVASRGVRWIAVHERFYVQQDPGRGPIRYAETCRQLDDLLGEPLTREQEPAPEMDAFLPPGFTGHAPSEREIRVYDVTRLR